MRKAQAIAHGLLFQRGMILDQKKHPLNGTCRSGNIGAFTRQAKHCAAADSRDGKLFLQQADVAVAVSKNRRRDLHTIQFDALFSHTAPPEISIELHAYCTTKSARRKL